MKALVWLRVLDDIVLSVGVLLLVLSAVKLLMGRRHGQVAPIISGTALPG